MVLVMSSFVSIDCAIHFPSHAAPTIETGTSECRRSALGACTVWCSWRCSRCRLSRPRTPSERRWSRSRPARCRPASSALRRPCRFSPSQQRPPEPRRVAGRWGHSDRAVALAAQQPSLCMADRRHLGERSACVDHDRSVRIRTFFHRLVRRGERTRYCPAARRLHAASTRCRRHR